jgi:hypothetical protein
VPKSSSRFIAFALVAKQQGGFLMPQLHTTLFYSDHCQISGDRTLGVGQFAVWGKLVLPPNHEYGKQ